MVAARTPGKARDSMARHVSESVEYSELADAPLADLVASTVPSDAVAGRLLERLSAAPMVFDAIYHPWPTALAAAAEAVVVSGLDLLVHQANLQNQLFAGTDRDLVEVMRQAGEAELRRRHG